MIDELAGRREATTRHLVVAGTLAILLQAALLDRLNLSVEINRLRLLGFYVAQPLEAEMLALYERSLKARRHP